jgi:osmoprotectant transport system substrate-binding protein
MHTPKHRTWKLLLALFSVLALFAAACGNDDEDDNGDDDPTTTTAPADDNGDDPGDDDNGDAAGPGDGPTIVIGAQDFGESEVLAQLYGQALEDAGYSVEYQSLGGFRDIVFSSFDRGEINFTAEYAASALEFLNEQAGEATSDADETADLLRDQLEERDLVALDPSPAANSNSFVVTQDTADDLGLSSIGDLTDDLTLGGPPDCPTNPFCIPGLQEVYDIDLEENFVSLDGGGPLTGAALSGGEIDVAIIFSTDGRIAEEGWVVLDDDEGLINADNIIPVLSQELIDAYGDDLVDLVNSISADLDTDSLTELNYQYDIELRDASEVAREWLEDNGYL